MQSMLLCLILAVTLMASAELCSKTRLRGRSGPGVSNGVVCTMNKNDKSKVLDLESGWYKLEVITGPCAPNTMYSSGEYLKDCGIRVWKCAKNSGVTVYAVPSATGTQLATLPEGTKISLVGDVYDGWVQIKAPAVPRGFVVVGDLEECPAGDSFLPEEPDITDNLGMEFTPISNYTGWCIPVSKCTGGTYNGLCPGSSNIKCCVPETKPAHPREEHVDLYLFRKMFTSLSKVRAEALLPYFNEALDTLLEGAGSDAARCQRITAFAAQVAHESQGLLFFEENASGEDYEGRCSDLGNCEPGDGKRYKGRGAIQLTGRVNYQSAGIILGLPLEEDPELVNMPSTGFRTSVWFWQSKNLNRHLTGTAADFDKLSEEVNGGVNHLEERRNLWIEALNVMCPDQIPVTPAPTGNTATPEPTEPTGPTAPPTVAAPCPE